MNIRGRNNAVSPLEASRLYRLSNHLNLKSTEKPIVLARAKEKGWDLDPETAGSVVEQVKALEHEGYLFEAADASFDLLVRRATGWEQDLFEVESFRTSSERSEDGVVRVEAEVVSRIGIAASEPEVRQR